MAKRKKTKQKTKSKCARACERQTKICGSKEPRNYRNLENCFNWKFTTLKRKFMGQKYRKIPWITQRDFYWERLSGEGGYIQRSGIIYGGREQNIRCAWNIDIVASYCYWKISTTLNKYTVVSRYNDMLWITSVDRSFFFMFVCHFFPKLSI